MNAGDKNTICKETCRRFVVLYHTWPYPHYDLMLEWRGVLKTWRLPELPRPGVCVIMEAIGDHCLAYIDYEGPVSGNRGEVRRVDAGVYEGDLNVSGRPIKLIVSGQRLQGVWQMTARPDGTSWELYWLLET